MSRHVARLGHMFIYFSFTKNTFCNLLGGVTVSRNGASPI